MPLPPGHTPKASTSKGRTGFGTHATSKPRAGVAPPPPRVGSAAAMAASYSTDYGSAGSRPGGSGSIHRLPVVSHRAWRQPGHREQRIRGVGVASGGHHANHRSRVDGGWHWRATTSGSQCCPTPATKQPPPPPPDQPSAPPPPPPDAAAPAPPPPPPPDAAAPARRRRHRRTRLRLLRRRRHRRRGGACSAAATSAWSLRWCTTSTSTAATSVRGGDTPHPPAAAWGKRPLKLQVGRRAGDVHGATAAAAAVGWYFCRGGTTIPL